NWDVTAVADPGGNVLERYVYDPYGAPTRLAANWGAPGADTLKWQYLHQGGRYESGTGLYHFRERGYSPTLGRWMQVDPISFAGGDTNLYRYVSNAPTSGFDPIGLAVFRGTSGDPTQPPPPPPDPSWRIEQERVQAEMIANYERMCRRELPGWVTTFSGPPVSATISVGVTAEVYVGFRHVQVSAELAFGYSGQEGYSGGMVFTGGDHPAIGAGGGVSVFGTLTNAPSVSQLGGSSTTIGVSGGPYGVDYNVSRPTNNPP